MRGAILARPIRRAPEAAESQPLEGSSVLISDPQMRGAMLALTTRRSDSEGSGMFIAWVSSQPGSSIDEFGHHCTESKETGKHKNRQVSQKYCKEWLHNTSFSVELDRTHPSMVPVHETSPGGEVRRVESGPSVR